MANEEQLKILKQGVEVWNRWRKEHPDEKIDLRDVNLVGEDLRRADLEKVDLKRVNLKEADLRGVNLKEADLRKADLTGANLIDAKLTDANLIAANLTEANLTKTKLSGANLTVVTLTKANLTLANLGWTRLVETNLSEANITGVCLYGTARDHWKIDGIQCDYVYWDTKHYRMNKEREKQWELEHRFPKDRDFRQGEFEELYKQLPTFGYVFEHGFTALDAVVMSRVVQAINERYPEFELKLDSFHSRGQPHAKFTVLHKENIEEALKQVTTKYETQLQVLEGQKEQLMKVIAMLGSGGITIREVEGNVILRAGQDIIAGNKEQRSITAGRDYLEIKGQAKVNQVTTGNSFHDQAQQLIQTPLPQMEQLNTKEECMAHYQLLSEKLFELRQAYIIEADTEVKFKLKKQIEEAETDLNAIEQRVETMEQEGA